MTEILQKNKTSLPKRVSSLLFQLILPLFLGVLILWLVFRDTNFHKIWLIFKDANYYVLAFSLIFGLMGNTFRAFRWQLLLAPLGHKTRIRNIAFAVYGGYAVNFAIPRAGELWRCGMVSKTENIPFAQTVSTMILDRVMDLVSVIFIIFFASLLNAEYLIKQLTQNNAIHSKLNTLLTSVWFYHPHHQRRPNRPASNLENERKRKTIIPFGDDMGKLFFLFLCHHLCLRLHRKSGIHRSANHLHDGKHQHGCANQRGDGGLACSRDSSIDALRSQPCFG